MTGVRLSLALVFIGLCLARASAQIDVKIQMARKNFVAGETVAVSVSVTNQSGQDLVFQGSSRSSWIEFTVNGNRGNPLAPLGQPAFGSVKIPLGQTMTRTVDLSRLFPLQTMGNYAVYAVVRLPGQTTEGFLSNRIAFNINNALPYWTQKVGVPGKAGQNREFRVLNFNSGGKTMLYAQVVDSRTGNPMQTHSLGEALMFRKPSVVLDNRQVMHVLYLIGPTLWAHARVAPDGTLLGREFHKRGAATDPRLFASRDGVVQVANSIPYDPKAEAEARGRTRKASDRPGFIYE